jgi:HSP20 family protein
MAEQKNQSTEQSNREQGSTAIQREQSGGSRGSESRGIERRPEGRGTYPSIFSVSPGEFFTMSPITLMRRFTEDIDRAFGLSSMGEREFASPDELGWVPRVEVQRSGNNLQIHAELPGVKESDIRLEATENGLAIQGERKREQTSEKGGWHRSEFSYGQFYRLIPLPEDAQIDQAKASFSNGVLEVTVPVPEPANKRRQIPIGTSSGTQAGQASTSGGGERARTASGGR